MIGEFHAYIYKYLFSRSLQDIVVPFIDLCIVFIYLKTFVCVKNVARERAMTDVLRGRIHVQVLELFLCGPQKKLVVSEFMDVPTTHMPNYHRHRSFFIRRYVPQL